MDVKSIVNQHNGQQIKRVILKNPHLIEFPHVKLKEFCKTITL